MRPRSNYSYTLLVDTVMQKTGQSEARRTFRLPRCALAGPRAEFGGLSRRGRWIEEVELSPIVIAPCVSEGQSYTYSASTHCQQESKHRFQLFSPKLCDIKSYYYYIWRLPSISQSRAFYQLASLETLMPQLIAFRSVVASRALRGPQGWSLLTGQQEKSAMDMDFASISQ